MAFQFRTGRRRGPVRVVPDVAFSFQREVEQEQLSGQVQGKSASDIEERVARALYKLQLPFRFQVDYFGGRSLSGGLVLDFLVLTPLPIPILVQGEYWHSGESKARDAYNIARLLDLFKGQIAVPVELFGQDLQSQEDADRQVRQAVLGY